MNWFGDSWGAPVNAPAAKVDKENWHACVDMTPRLSAAVARRSEARTTLKNPQQADAIRSIVDS